MFTFQGDPNMFTLFAFSFSRIEICQMTRCDDKMSHSLYFEPFVQFLLCKGSLRYKTCQSIPVNSFRGIQASPLRPCNLLWIQWIIIWNIIQWRCHHAGHPNKDRVTLLNSVNGYWNIERWVLQLLRTLLLCNQYQPSTLSTNQHSLKVNGHALWVLYFLKVLSVKVYQSWLLREL